MSVFEWVTPMPVTFAPVPTWLYLPERVVLTDTGGPHTVEIWRLRRVA